MTQQQHDERNPAEGRDELPARDLDCGLMTRSDKLPPTADDLASNQLLWLVARVCHEANRAYCADVMADQSHLPWADTGQEQRDSVYAGVVKYFEEPELSPEQGHAAWCEYKAAEGWTFGNMKDAQAKTHPCLLPYHQLHQHDRAKDSIFAAICKGAFGA